MKTYLRNLAVLAVSLVASAAFATPAVEVTARQISTGKVLKKVRTDANGNFVLNRLPAGAYSLEFRCRASSDLKDKLFTLTIEGTKQIGTQGGIAGHSLVGGVALDVEVASGARVTGQMATGVNVAKTPTMYWAPKRLDSNLPGHWTANSSDVPASQIVGLPKDWFRKAQDFSVDSNTH